MTITTSAGCIERLGEQIERERQGKLQGMALLRSRTEALVNKNSATQSVVWRAVLHTGLVATADLMEEKWKSISTRPGVDHAELMACLPNMDKKVLALLGLKVCLDSVARGSDTTFTHVCEAVGKTVQQEARMRWYREQNPKLYAVISSRRFHAGSTAWHKEQSMTFSMNEADITWKPWKAHSCARIGLWIIGCIAEATGWITREVRTIGSKKTVAHLSATPILAKLVKLIWKQALELASVKTPFIISPPDWYWNEAACCYEGGYTDTEIHGRTPVLRVSEFAEDVIGPVALEAVNRIQRVAYRVNPVVLRVATWAKDRYYGQIGEYKASGSFFYGEAKEIPGDFLNAEEDEEGLKEWKKAKARLYDFNSQVAANNLRTDTIISQAENLKNDVFYFVWKFDYRGRLYPDQPVFNPQGIDLVRAFFYFAEEGPVNHDWLAFQVATTYGLDKATLAERLQWVKGNRELISAIAADPEGTIPLWEAADEPWQFLAACCEYHACCIARTKTTSGLPVGIDATCSGLQHLSALTRDRTAAALVNVVPQGSVADGYRTVAEAAQPLLPERVRPWITRKVTKRTVMTTPYGVTRHSARGYIRAQLREDKRDLSEEGLLTRITSAIFDVAMPSVFAGPVAVMKWIQKSSATAIEDKKQLSWQSPSGFKVVQKFMGSHIIEIKTMLMGSTKVKIKVADGNTDEVDKPHHRAASAPNLVHSCDAALLHFVLSDWDRPIYTVHDCVQGRSCDMDELASKVRTHFCEMYRGRDVLADWARDVGVEPNPDLIVGDLDIEEVLDSKYFFC